MPHRFIGSAPDEINGFPFYLKRLQFNSPIALYNLSFRVFFTGAGHYTLLTIEPQRRYVVT